MWGEAGMVDQLIPQSSSIYNPDDPEQTPPSSRQHGTSELRDLMRKSPENNYNDPKIYNLIIQSQNMFIIKFFLRNKNRMNIPTESPLFKLQIPGESEDKKD
jgi:hypothetical protein